jgi:hypothetical protein
MCSMPLFVRRILLLSLLLPLTMGAQAAGRDPWVVAVPSRPAFVKPPGAEESQAVSGQRLPPRTLLRTQRPGRLQVKLADGRSFRLGGDALVRLDRDALNLQRGQIIAWVNPGSQGQGRLRIRTRVATASIEGTTVFLEVSDSQVKVFSWEGRVRVTTDAGARVELNGGEELLYQNDRWQPPRRLSRQEASTRLAKSLLLNDFPAPMETMPLIRQTLEGTPEASESPDSGAVPNSPASPR